MIKQNSKQKKNSEFYESKITLHSSRTISKDLALRACTALKLKAIGIIRTFEFSKLGQKPFFRNSENFHFCKGKQNYFGNL